jgi:carbonic anhydrase/acetyltransferase-like protein (isoleucine patch superfamily)
MISLTVQDTGNKVSRRATIAGPQNIILGGKTIISSGAIIRGDLRRTGTGSAVVISLGRYCLISEGCIMRYDKVLVHGAVLIDVTQAAIQNIPGKL